MKTNGIVMSGMRSTRSALYEKSPSTQSATITIVANTGWLMLVRVIHIRLARSAFFRPVARRFNNTRSAFFRPVARRSNNSSPDRRLEDRRRARLEIRNARAHHRDAALEAALHLDQAFLAHAERHRAARDLAALDRIDVGLSRFLAHGARGDDRRRRRLVEDELALGEH